jgi:hypothetical protein
VSVEKAVTDTVLTTVKVVESVIKKAWSLMDAATEKKPPTETLSPKAIQAIQGVTKPGEPG